jgi:hypothetical protein
MGEQAGRGEVLNRGVKLEIEIEGDPKRNIWCRHYATCLDRAAMEECRNFECAGCRFFFDESGKTVAFDLIHDFLFLFAVFFPKVFAVFQRIKERDSTSSIDWEAAEQEIRGRLIRKNLVFFTKLFQGEKTTPGLNDESDDFDENENEDRDPH